MIRRGLCAVALALLTHTASASTECAWVLWGKTTGSDAMPMERTAGWLIRETFDRRTDCLRALAEQLTVSRRNGWMVIGTDLTGAGAVINYPDAGPWKYEEHIVCRPDSVPPK